MIDSAHDSIAIFNRKLLRLRRRRAEKLTGDSAFLICEIGARLAERISEIRRPLNRVLLIGQDISAAMLRDALPAAEIITMDNGTPMTGKAAERIIADEEALPFAADIFDAVIAPWGLHWVNDLPGCLAQIRYCLKPDGLFMACLPGPRSLQELRESLAHASASEDGGLRPRIAPFVEVRDAGNLLVRSDFALPMADNDMLTVTYPDMFALMHELRAMGETNMLHAQSKSCSRRAVFMQAAEYYRAHFTAEDGIIRASLELVTLMGWKPDASQPQPAKRGSGTMHFSDAFGNFP